MPVKNQLKSKEQMDPQFFLDLSSQKNRRDLAGVVKSYLEEHNHLSEGGFFNKQSLLETFNLQDNDITSLNGYKVNFLEARKLFIIVVESFEQTFLQFFAFKTTGNFDVSATIAVVESCLNWHNKLTKTSDLILKDELTGLYNYRFFSRALNHEISRSERFSKNFAILFIDVDHFKKVNDQYGHVAGSSVLRQIAAVVQDSIREVDVATRYGGDEFVVIALETLEEGAKVLAERIRQKVAAHHFKVRTDKLVGLSVSIGVATYPQTAASKDDLLKLADKTMYDSKKAGRNCVTVFSSDN